MQKQRVMTIIFVAVLCVSVLGGCGHKISDKVGTKAVSEQQKYISSDAELSEIKDDSNVEDMAADHIFEKIAGKNFYFSSGAGAWETKLVIESDGTFSGSYHDTDAGISGNGYPNGTMYRCDFTGMFTIPKKLNDYTYSMQIKSLKASQPEGKEEIIDGQKIIYTDTAYGLDGAKDIYIYFPGTPVSRLPEGFLSWVDMALKDTDTILPFYGLYNVDMEEGFIGPEEDVRNLQNNSQINISDTAGAESDISSELQEIESQAAAIENRLKTEPLDQSTMNLLSAQLYKLWDDELNSVWGRLKTTLDSAAMDKLTQEEKKWISNKENAIEQAGLEYDGGTMRPMVENQTGADLTKQRVYELSQYLK